MHADAAFALARGAAAAARRRRATRARGDLGAPVVALQAGERRRRGDAVPSRRRRRGAHPRARGSRGDLPLHLPGRPEYWTDDSRFAAQLVAELLPGEPNIHVDTSFRTPEQLADALRGFDVAIATRMHFAILALAVATPVVAIAYEFKSRELLRAMGREAWAFDIEEVSSEGLLRATREALAGGDTLRAGIAAQVVGYRDDAIGPARRIREALGAGTRGGRK